MGSEKVSRWEGIKGLPAAIEGQEELFVNRNSSRSSRTDPAPTNPDDEKSREEVKRRTLNENEGVVNEGTQHRTAKS